MEEEEEITATAAAAEAASPKLIVAEKSQPSSLKPSSVTNGALTVPAPKTSLVTTNGDLLHDDEHKSKGVDISSAADSALANVDPKQKQENGDHQAAASNQKEGKDAEVPEKADKELPSPETAKSKTAAEIEGGEDDNAVDVDLLTAPAAAAAPKEEVENDPNFAVICSFLAQFGAALEIRYSIWQLKMMFEDYSKGRRRRPVN